MAYKEKMLTRARRISQYEMRVQPGSEIGEDNEKNQ